MTAEGGFALDGRWRPGHQAFDVLLAGLNVCLGRAAEELVIDAIDSLENSLSSIRELLDASTAAMFFAADFDPRVYREDVRPTMAPPNMPDGFSGTLNERHSEFLAKFRVLRAALETRFGNHLETAPPVLTNIWRELLKARSENLRAHGLICARFVPGGDSLLREHLRSKGGEESS